MDEKNITQEQAAATVQDAQAQEPAAGAGAAHSSPLHLLPLRRKAGAHVHPGGRE